MAKKMKDFKNRLFSRLETGIREHVGLDVQDVAVGITYTAVLLSNGILGVSASYLGKNFESCFNAGKIHDVGCFHECDLEG
ncbi:MAG: enolase N-terminal-like fold-containing protein, partial [Candidatus Hodarchaeota archaeon]